MPGKFVAYGWFPPAIQTILRMGGAEHAKTREWLLNAAWAEMDNRNRVERGLRPRAIPDDEREKRALLAGMGSNSLMKLIDLLSAQNPDTKWP